MTALTPRAMPQATRNPRITWRAIGAPLGVVGAYVGAAALLGVLGVWMQRKSATPGPSFDTETPILFGELQLAYLLSGVVIPAVTLVIVVMSLRMMAPWRAGGMGPKRWAPGDFIAIAVAAPIGAFLFFQWPTPIEAERAARREGLLAATARLAPLVSALERYERERGAPPDSLGDLVPAYLSAPPSHPIRACRTLQYTARTPPSARWMLRMDCPNLGFMNLDSFIFQPDGDYRPSLERIGRWAYHWD